MSTKKLKYSDVECINEVYYYNNISFSGILIYELSSEKIASEIEYLDGIKNGQANFYNENGDLTIQKNYKNGIKHGIEYHLLSNGEKIRESHYSNGKHLKSIHFDKKGKEIENLHWFCGNIYSDRLKIRKYYITNRYCFSPNLLWIENIIISSIFSYILLLLYESCIESSDLNKKKLTNQFSISYILSQEILVRNKTTFKLEDLKFKNKTSKEKIKYNLNNFKKYFPNYYKNIFNDHSLEDIIELSKYKILNHNYFTFSSTINDIVETNENIASLRQKIKDLEDVNSIETVKNKIALNARINFKKHSLVLKEFFNTKHLEIMDGFNDDYKKWIILDKTVMPIGIVFESDSKTECEKWINLINQ
ncbi:hypothetical protein OAR04_00750 [Flavobacteriales bacterium]|nr:hypothetical protein [Flavobacteriales bacterium]